MLLTTPIAYSDVSLEGRDDGAINWISERNFGYIDSFAGIFAIRGGPDKRKGDFGH